MAAGIFTLVWCVTILLSSLLFARTPNISLFPEVDFASKVVVEGNSCRIYDSSSSAAPVAKRLSPLSNATSTEIRNKLAAEVFLLRRANRWESDVRGNGPVAIILQDKDLPLSRNSLYLYIGQGHVFGMKSHDITGVMMPVTRECVSSNAS